MEKAAGRDGAFIELLFGDCRQFNIQWVFYAGEGINSLGKYCLKGNV